MHLLRDVGTAYQQLSQFNCRRAIELLTALPAHQHNTGWVLSMLGKAHFELNDYKQAIRSVSQSLAQRLQTGHQVSQSGPSSTTTNRPSGQSVRP